MLIEFSVANYLSFKDRVTLSMIASKDDSLPGNVIHNAQGSEYNLLKTAAIYGANASGKSNLIKAIGFMDEFVRNSHKGQQGDRIDVVPFKLDEKFSKKPSEFEIVYLWNGIQYVYGFSVDSKRVYEEWLYSYPKKYRRTLFEREYDNKSDKYSIEFGSNWKGERKKLEGMTRSNSLFISVAAQFNHEIAQIVLGWFNDQIQNLSGDPYNPSFYDPNPPFTVEYAIKKKKMKDKIVNFLINADLGIKDFSITKKTLKDVRSDDIPSPVKEMMEDFMKETKKEIFFIERLTLHKGKDLKGNNKEIFFKVREESDGTNKMFNLAGYWLSAFMKTQQLIIDELAIHLHPFLTEYLIKLFHEKKTNKKDAQLIFTTHDSSILDHELFRRDQIWFTEKNFEEGYTNLYSLLDFKARKYENFRNGYLVGKYGAIPFIDDNPL